MRTERRASGRLPVVGRRGALVAVVGPEATGKSTVLEEIERRLPPGRRVLRIHAGRPPATPLTLVPRLLLPALRALFPEQRLTRVEARNAVGAAEGRSAPPLFALRAVMLAYERRALLARAARAAARGALVVSDRYPPSVPGAPDGPQLAGARGGRLVRWLGRLEGRLYAGVPAPDLVIHLAAPLEVTLARNAARGKREPEAYVRLRHALASNLRFDRAQVRRVDAARPLAEVVREVEEAIRGVLPPEDED